MYDFNINPFRSAQGFGKVNKQNNDAETEQVQQTEQTNPTTKQHDDDLLTSNIYEDMGCTFSSTKSTSNSTSLDALQGIQDFNVTTLATNSDRQIAYNAVSDPLTKAYMYGPVSEETTKSLNTMSEQFFALQDPNYTFYVPEDVA
jgi:hypothetical protein